MNSWPILKAVAVVVLSTNALAAAVIGPPTEAGTEIELQARLVPNYFGDSIRDSCPLKRIGEPEDMAGIAIYLASRAGAYVTGAVIPVDGGISQTK